MVTRTFIAVFSIIAATAVAGPEPLEPGPDGIDALDETPFEALPANEAKARLPPEVRTAPAEAPRGLSWTVLTGRTLDEGGYIHGEMGFSSLPRLVYRHAIGHGIALGVSGAFDYAGTRITDAFSPTFALGATAQYGLALPADLDLGIRATLGFRIPGPSRTISIPGAVTNQLTRDAALFVDVEANLGYLVEHRLIVGGGLSVPLEIGFGGIGETFNVPFLFGPIVEFHVTPPIALTFEVKVGPHFSSADGTDVGLRSLLGVAYRI